ncbi:glycosyltransferase family 2 protein [Thermodesulfobacteriota bacterium]
MKVTVVIPVYNEVRTIGEILTRVQETGIVGEIIVVDDCSVDGTREFLERARKEDVLKVLFHERNMGKGAALRTGFREITGDVVIIQDADLEYDPKDYSKLLEPIRDGRADVVYGSRFLGGPHRVLLFWHYLGNKLLTLLSNMFTNLNLTDMETGYKVFKAHVLRDIELRSNRFGVEPELTAKIARKRHIIYELPISYSGRDYSQGKKITWKDGLVALYSIIRFRFFD